MKNSIIYGKENIIFVFPTRTKIHPYTAFPNKPCVYLSFRLQCSEMAGYTAHFVLVLRILPLAFRRCFQFVFRLLIEFGSFCVIAGLLCICLFWFSVVRPYA